MVQARARVIMLFVIPAWDISIAIVIALRFAFLADEMGGGHGRYLKRTILER